MGCTAALSSISDWVCGGIVSETARNYATAVRTPNYFVEMLLWIEDKRFSVHFGVDPIAVVRALVFNSQGRTRQGASTIVQQLYAIQLGRSQIISRTLPYKIKQIGTALYLSAAMSKASVLREYVDTVYWGRSYCGLDKAADGYFGTKRGHLTITQSFFLAERLATPNRVSPKRLTNLLKRAPIRMGLIRNGATIDDVIGLYEQIYGRKGESWQILAK